ncbi:MAG: ferredoxin [Coriobacteriia bacterium]|nr:ferredoxin [Coriobacteriia bacterium]
MKPMVDQDLCIGCGNCEDVCPEFFRLGDDGFSHVTVEDADEKEYGCAREAADGCPVGAISFAE